MKALRGRHAGETATIVGCGPSIITLRADHFPPGPVIAVNHSILMVRSLRLTNTVYSMQKDGCIPHTGSRRPPARCCCPSPMMVPPREPEELLLSVAESSRCFARYPRRHLFDVQKDFGLSWHTMSVPVAARIAHAMGCTSLLMLGMDSYVHGSNDRFLGKGSPGPGYRGAAVRAREFAEDQGMAIEFR